MHEAAESLVHRMPDVAAMEELWLSANVHTWLKDVIGHFQDPVPQWVKFLQIWKRVRSLDTAIRARSTEKRIRLS